MSLKLASGTITFNSDHVLEEAIRSIEPFVEKILISEGPVSFFKEKGFDTSIDRTNEILDILKQDFGDKIHITHGTFHEKDSMCNSYMHYLPHDTDYLIQIDSDEVYTSEGMENLIRFLEKKNPISCGVRPYSFFGGFDRYITGFEQATDNFLRIFKTSPGCIWKSHRPPTMSYLNRVECNEHVTSDQLYDEIGFKMYHYSYAFLTQVKSKIEYYHSKVAKDKVIDDYFNKIWLPWVLSESDEEKRMIEGLYQGVHEFKYECRGPAFTEKFNGKHPQQIEKSLSKLKERFERELNEYR